MELMPMTASNMTASNMTASNMTASNMTASNMTASNMTSSIERLILREEILDRIIDIVISIKKLNISLSVDYSTITNRLKNDFNKINAYRLIERMKQDSQLQSYPLIYNRINEYYEDIMIYLDFVSV